MKQHRKLIVAAVLAAALAGGAGVATASGGGGDAKETESYSVPNKQGDGPEEKGLTDATADNGEPGHTQGGTEPSHGGEPDTHSYPTR